MDQRRLRFQGVAHRDSKDGNGRFEWRAPDYPAGWNDATVTITCTHKAIDSKQRSLSLRVSRVERATSFSVEGGALIPSLGGRIWALATSDEPGAAELRRSVGRALFLDGLLAIRDRGCRAGEAR